MGIGDWGLGIGDWVTSWIGVLLKIVIIGMVGIIEWNIIKTILPKKLQEKLNPEYAQQVDELSPV